MTARAKAPTASARIVSPARAADVLICCIMRASDLMLPDCSHMSPASVKNINGTNKNKRSPYGDQPDRLVTLHQPQQHPRSPTAWRGKPRVVRQKLARVALRHGHERGLSLQIGHAEARKPRLRGADEIARPAHLQIHLGNPKAVLGGAHGL